ncbi:MAG: 2TM domain-containing protein [Chloroflexota bacterium]|nr:2TM domain-containing protein [Chloroflexota bacterium]
MIKYKAKPIPKAEIRERVEKKFRARGNILFHALVFLIASGLFLAYLPTAWADQFGNGYRNGFIDSVMLYGIVATSFALSFFHYHYKYGAGYHKHQAETDALVNRRLRQSDPDEWEDQEELVDIQQSNKLKNRRLLLQHLALYLGANSMFILVQWSNTLRFSWFDDAALLGPLYFAGAWGVGLLAQALRYFFAYGYSAEKRQAKIDAEVARELAMLARENRPVKDRQAQRAPAIGSSQDRLSIDALIAEDLEQPRREMKV